MEDPAILKMNIDHFKRLLEIEADPTKRQTDPKLIRETEEKLQQDRLSSGAIPQTGLSRRPTSTSAGDDRRRDGVSSAKSLPPEAAATSVAEPEVREASLAALHQLGAGLTAATSYLASTIRLAETDAALAATSPHRAEISEKALAQVSRADEAAKRLRQLLDKERAEFAPICRGHIDQEEGELRQARDIEQLGHLTEEIGHDLSNLMTILQYCLEMLSGRQANPQLQAKVDMALQTIDRAERLSGQLFDVARRPPSTIAPVDLNAQLRHMADLLTATVGNAVSLEIDLEARLWPVFVDPARFDLAVINIAANARDAMPTGGVLRIRTFNTAAPEETGEAADFVAVEISDSGTGMSPETLARAFDPFFTTKGPGKGTGLGLSMVHSFARQSDGTVAIRSEIARGTTVSLHLPRSPERPQDRFWSQAASDTRLHQGASQ